MIQLSPSQFYLMLEAIGLLAVVAIACAGYLVWRLRQKQKVLLALVARLKENGPQRIEALSAALQAAGIDDDAQRNEHAQKILAAETNLYRFLIQALLKNEGRQLMDLDKQVESLIQDLAISVPAGSSATAANAGTAGAAESSSVLDAISTENSKLLTELKSTRDELKKAIAGIGSVTPTTAAPVSTAPEPVEAEPASVPEPEPAPQQSNSLDIEELDLDFDDGPTSAPTAAAASDGEDIVDLGALETAITDDESPAIAQSAAPENKPAEQDDTSSIDEIPDDLLFAQPSDSDATPATADEDAALIVDVNMDSADEVAADEGGLLNAEIDEAALEEEVVLTPNESVEEQSTADAVVAAAPESTAADDLSELELDLTDLDQTAGAADASVEVAAAATAQKTATVAKPAQAEKTAAPLSLDPDDILEQIASASPPPETELEVETEADSPSGAEDATAPVQEFAAQDNTTVTTSEIDPDALLDSLLGVSDANEATATEDDELMPVDSTAIDAGGPEENKKNNDIVSESGATATGEALALDEPLIPDSEDESNQTTVEPTTKPTAKPQDKEALIAELEDLLG